MVAAGVLMRSDTNMKVDISSNHHWYGSTDELMAEGVQQVSTSEDAQSSNHLAALARFDAGLIPLMAPSEAIYALDLATDRLSRASTSQNDTTLAAQTRGRLVRAQSINSQSTNLSIEFERVLEQNKAEEFAKTVQDSIVLDAKIKLITNICNLVLIGTGLGLSIAVTVLSGGLSVPIMAALGVSFVIAVADVLCAYADWQEKKNGNFSGLPQGDDSLANLLYFLLNKCGLEPETVKFWSKFGSVLAKVLLTVGTLWAGITQVGHVASQYSAALAASHFIKSTIGAPIAKFTHFATSRARRTMGRSTYAAYCEEKKTNEKLVEAHNQAMDDKEQKISALQTELTLQRGFSQRIEQLSDEKKKLEQNLTSNQQTLSQAQSELDFAQSEIERLRQSIDELLCTEGLSDEIRDALLTIQNQRYPNSANYDLD